MSVNINIDPALRYFTNGVDVVKVNGDKVRQCVEHLAELFPKLELFDEDSKLPPYLCIFVNGKIAFPKELEKTVKDGDELSITLMLGGG